jgi:ATP-dependent RNA helicase RhlE
MNDFSDFDLISSLQETLEEMGLNTPTDIQQQAIPLLLDGQSVVGVSETGSGKTLAYALPILNALKTLEYAKVPVEDESQPRALVIVPSRELGEQVMRVFKTFTHATRLRVRSVLGGTDLDVAKRNIEGEFEILVATPGRILKLLDRKLINFSDVRTLVFDEADQMLDQGFLPDARRLVEACPRQVQLALFSATVSSQLEELIASLFKDAKVLRSSGHHRLVATLTTQNRKVVDGKRFPLLLDILKDRSPEGTMIFTNTREQCDRLAEELKKAGMECVVYRGEMDKGERRLNLRAFKEKKVSLLISTDLAARGLDLEHVGRVINYHLPQDMANYLHRVGRTARAGRPGLVVNLVTERDAELIRKLDSLNAS